MRRALSVLGGVVVMLALTALVRPATDLALFLRLNGQPTVFVMPDGGRAGLYGSGQQCMTVTPGDVLKLTPSAAIYLCTPSPTGMAQAGTSPGVWDGGCSATTTDMNGGDYIGANVEHFVTVNDATNMCQVPVTGSVNTPVFRMQ